MSAAASVAMPLQQRADPLLSEVLRMSIGGGRPSLCYWNALKAVGAARKLHHGVRYVEGWAVAPGEPAPLHHGWLEMADGTVLDPSWGRHSEAAVYFAGVRYDAAEAVARARADDIPGLGPWLPLADSGTEHGAWRIPEWRAAFLAAWAAIDPLAPLAGGAVRPAMLPQVVG